MGGEEFGAREEEREVGGEEVDGEFGVIFILDGGLEEGEEFERLEGIPGGGLGGKGEGNRLRGMRGP